MALHNASKKVLIAKIAKFVGGALEIGAEVACQGFVIGE